ncbi:hypothetical protein [Miltoncostaea oceani]|uniref:hypothetical protein n=1 Tax=Miltoncostaea oceani TaxID=2843216 RepID=UPI001C3D741C|nr:hypothetical protein [Miltoncostaea oceani]
MTTTRVLVLWTGFRAGVQTCRALTRAGWTVVGAHPAGVPGGASRWCRRPLRYPPAHLGEDAFLAWLQDTCRRASIDVVLPVDEDLVRLLARRRPGLGDAVVVGPTEEQYDALCDKRRLADSARAAGVDHPDTITVGPDGPDGPWPALPSIVKPVISHSDMSVARITMAATEAERDEQVGLLVAAGLDALVQERVEGPRWVGHCVRGPSGLALVPSRILRDYPRGTGVACVQRTTLPPPGLVRGVARLLDLVDYRGPATISFLQRDDRMHVHDVNLRIGASVGLLVRSGFDIPSRAVAAALGREAPPDARWRPTRYVWLDGELGALRDALRGRGVGDPPARVAGRIAAAAVLPGRMTDPAPLDPWWLAGHLAPRLRRRPRP